MSGSTLLLSILALSSVARADYFSKDPLNQKVVPHDQIPYQVMTDTDDPRGFQSGYNQCNSTTENQESLCQTMYVNHIDDWCLWAPAPPNTPISEAEGDVVAWCSKAGHGTRIIPAGAVTGLQFVQTQSYIQVAGTINQALLNVGGTDGGELDSGGQDGEGNPMGGLVYSNSFPSSNGDNNTFAQVQRWSFFIGNNAFCGKVCDMTGKNPAGLCNNIYDRLGCDYNAPNTAQEGTFEFCKGDDMIPVGTYVVNGVTSVYTQPPEASPIDYDNLPYTATPAPTSSCITYQSADLFAAGATISGASAPASASATPSGSASASASASGSGSGSGSGSIPAGAATSAKASTPVASTKPSSGSSSGSGAAASPSASGSSGAAAAWGVSGAAVVAGFVAVFAL
ncbi:hypothetical protein FB45DRAFT_944594 [Roridomyces roridus]|uniref:Macrofage activating glycoprotein n=1 Tax=Roridomyces roridus TaxID=1738132 RepID=A0AAD7FAV2_9AGAR|nr:hypothetical protein FB45DRAFT_944594 [Roridomyces roridus]